MGLTPAWEFQKSMDGLLLHARRMVNAAGELKPDQWAANGAPAAYAEQAKSLNDQLRYLAQSAEALKRSPEKLTLALETFFRLQSLESLLDSVSQGVRKYQNPALADLMQGMIAENETNRGRLRSYVLELSSTKETELRIMNEEAQRCRDAVIRQPAPRKPAERKQPGP